MNPDFESARAHFQAGLTHFGAQEWALAEAQFRASLVALPGRVSTLTNLGATLLKLGRPLDALATLNEALNQAPTDVEALSHQGLALVELARGDEALAAFDRVLAQVPDHRAARTQRAFLLNRAGRHQQALAELEKLLAQESADAESWLAHARTLHRLGRIAPALQSYAQALTVEPEHAQAWSERGGLLKDAGRLDEAAACFERALALGADTALNAYHLAAVTGAQAPPEPPARYVEQLFDGYADEFDSHLRDRLGYQAPQVLARHLPGLAQRNYRDALDLGCGTGLCGAPFAPFVDALDGVDLSAAMLAKALVGGHYRRLAQADLASHLAVTESRYDLVLATDTFIYVGALDAVFAGVRRVIRAGGVFCFSLESTPDDDDYVLRPSSRYAHSKRYIAELAQRHGFAVTAVHEDALRRDQASQVRGLYVYLTLA